MNIIDTPLADLKVLEPKVFGDERGYFFESFNQQRFNAAIGREVVFVQDNQSRSAQGVLRGLHFQFAPHAQGKLVRVVTGEVFDVAVDIRPDSATFGQWHAEYLSAANKKQMWIPEGFAHGFLVTSTNAEFLYKTTDYWHPELEGAIKWDDAELSIDWPKLTDYQLSEKDLAGLSFKEMRQHLR